MSDRREIEIDYTNWRGERRTRRILPIRLEFGRNKYHKVDQWLILANDLEDGGAEKTFALAYIHAVCPTVVRPNGEHVPAFYPDGRRVEDCFDVEAEDEG